MAVVTNVIECRQLTKTYGGARGISDITLDVPKGTIFGFLGPNGAGKSTTINMMINLTKPSSGSVEIFGKDAVRHGLELRRDIGFLSSDMALDNHLTGRQQLEYFGNLRGGYDESYVNKLATRFDCDLDRRQRTLSRGNRQKIGLLTALMHKPKLLILDEPTSGLDPLIQAEFNTVIREHQAAGHTTFISSHVLSEIQELCDHVAFIREGKLIASTTIDSLVKAAPKLVRVVSQDARVGTSLKRLPGVLEYRTHRHIHTFAFKGDLGVLIKALAKHTITDLSIENTDLESTFMSYYEREGTKDAA